MQNEVKNSYEYHCKSGRYFYGVIYLFHLSRNEITSVNTKTNRKITIRFTIASLFVFAIVLTSTIAIGFQYSFGRQLATEHALSSYSDLSRSIGARIQGSDADSLSVTKLLAKIGSTERYRGLENERALIDLFTETMETHPHIYSLYYAVGDDYFFQLINLDSDPKVRDKTDAHIGERWVLNKVFNGENGRVKETTFLDYDHNGQRVETVSSSYFPSQRPWYEDAGSQQPYKTEPYLFQHLKLTGQTYSIQIPNSNAILGVDVVIDSISHYLTESSLGVAGETGKQAFIFSSNGNVIASNHESAEAVKTIKLEPMTLSPYEAKLVETMPVLKVSNQMQWAPIDYAVSGEPKGLAIDILDAISAQTGLRFEYINGLTWSELTQQFERRQIDVLHSVLYSDPRAQIAKFSQPLYELPFGVVTKDNGESITNVEQLQSARVGILEGWEITQSLRERFPSMTITIFSTPQEVVEAVVNGEVDAGIDSTLILKHTLERFFVQGLVLHSDVEIYDRTMTPQFHLMVQPEFATLIPLINRAIASIPNDVRVSINNKWFDYFSNDSSATQYSTIPYEQLLDISSQRELQGGLVEGESSGEKHYFYVSQLNENEYFGVVIPQSLVFKEALNKVVLSLAATTILILLLLPIAWWLGSPIVKPILLLEKETEKIKTRRYGEIHSVPSRVLEISQLSNAVEDMAASLAKHEKSQQELLDAFIKLIAQAIDDKSPYTAGHCNRVPEVGFMLADAAHNMKEGPLAGFSFANKEEKREFEIAAWLHDCGKITTPEHIVDKGSKLEANYNRIHEIRTRFEVLWRDAEIECLRKTLENPDERSQFETELATKREQLQQEFTAVATANVGNEYMSDDKKQQIRDIANRTWVRNFDDKLGLSPLETRRSRPTKTALPTVEKLLSDKPEHVIERERPYALDERFGIKMDVPKSLYNLGEVYNLTIERGTLTAEDRFKINEHVISTIKMLENLPFPEELKRVPRYASTHHETLDGRGYPRKLSAHELSVPERILAIADIFEALTASDRPYKNAKPMNVAIDIMSKMVEDNHLDRDLFELFLESGIHKKYAELYLPEGQAVDVDIEPYLNRSKAKETIA